MKKIIAVFISMLFLVACSDPLPISDAEKEMLFTVDDIGLIAAMYEQEDKESYEEFRKYDKGDGELEWEYKFDAAENDMLPLYIEQSIHYYAEGEPDMPSGLTGLTDFIKYEDGIEVVDDTTSFKYGDQSAAFQVFNEEIGETIGSCLNFIKGKYSFSVVTLGMTYETNEEWAETFLPYIKKLEEAMPAAVANTVAETAE